MMAILLPPSAATGHVAWLTLAAGIGRRCCCWRTVHLLMAAVPWATLCTAVFLFLCRRAAAAGLAAMAMGLLPVALMLSNPFAATHLAEHSKAGFFRGCRPS
jgi:hypothetical protein